MLYCRKNDLLFAEWRALIEKSIGLLLASAYLFHARSRQKSLKACLLKILYVFPKLLALNEIRKSPRLLSLATITK